MLKWRGPVNHLLCLMALPYLGVRYWWLNRNLKEDQIRVSSEVLLNVNSRTRETIECFCHGDGDIGIEMANFLQETREQKILCDIGALHGCFSFCFTSRNGKKSYAMEPSPRAKEVFEENSRLNPKLNVEHYPVAVGSKPGFLQMSMAWHHCVAFDFEAQKKGEKMITVPVVSLDEFFQDHTPADTLKIDVEGYEMEVLKGGLQYIQTYKPLIFLEIHSKILKDIGTPSAEIFLLLEGLGYQFYNTWGKRCDIQTLSRRIDDYRILCRP